MLQFIVKFKPTVGRARQRVLRDLQARSVQRFWLTGAEVITLDGISVEDAIARYRNDPGIEYIEPDYELYADRTPNDPRFSELYGMQNTGQTGGTADADIDATNAWDVFTGDANLKISVIDTGVDRNHGLGRQHLTVPVKPGTASTTTATAASTTSTATTSTTTTATPSTTTATAPTFPGPSRPSATTTSGSSASTGAPRSSASSS
jgi:hypothetical protein